jgi:hypothetical protein
VLSDVDLGRAGLTHIAWNTAVDDMQNTCGTTPWKSFMLTVPAHINVNVNVNVNVSVNGDMSNGKVLKTSLPRGTCAIN